MQTKLGRVKEEKKKRKMIGQVESSVPDPEPEPEPQPESETEEELGGLCSCISHTREAIHSLYYPINHNDTCAWPQHSEMSW